MKKFVLILAVIAFALTQGSCNRKATVEECEDTCVMDTLTETPTVDLDSICND